MCILAQAFLSRVGFNYIDLFIVAWLIVGVLVGRKRGMSQEVLPTLQWVCIMVAAGLCYRYIATFLNQTANLGLLLANLVAYVAIGLIVQFIFLSIRKSVGEKLVGSDVFGRGEYYLGMLAGAIRFACIVVCVMAVMNSRIYSEKEIDAAEKERAKWAEGIHFPTYPTFQRSVLFESFTGRQVKGNMGNFLIASVTGGGSSKSKSHDTIAKKEQRELDEVMGSTRK